MKVQMNNKKRIEEGYQAILKRQMERVKLRPSDNPIRDELLRRLEEGARKRGKAAPLDRKQSA